MTTVAATTSSAPGVFERRFGALVWCEVALALVVGSIGLGDKSLWLDEAYTATVSQGSWSSLVDSFRVDANASLYDAILRFWRVLGGGDASLRALSVVAVAACVGVIAMLGRRVHEAKVGLLAGLFLAVAPFALQFSQQVRGYALAMLLVTVASLCFVRAVERRTWIDWSSYTVVMTLALYAHLAVAFVLVAHAVSLAFLGRDRVPLRAFGASVCGIGVLCLPLAFLVADGPANQLWWLPSPSLRSAVGQPARLVGGTALAITMAAVVVVAVAMRVRAKRPLVRSSEAWRSWFAVSVVVSTYVAMVLFSLIVTPVYNARDLLVVLPVVLLVVARATLALPDRRLAVVAIAAILVLSGIGLADWWRRGPQDDWRGVAAYVLSRAEPGDGIAFCNPAVRRAFEYYARQSPRSQDLTPVSPAGSWGAGFRPLAGAREGRWPDRVWVVRSYQSGVTHAAADPECGLPARLRAYDGVGRLVLFDNIRLMLVSRASRGDT